jgi:hypothetical protein
MMTTLGLGKAKGHDAWRGRSDGGAEIMAGVVRHKGPKRKIDWAVVERLHLPHVSVHRSLTGQRPSVPGPILVSNSWNHDLGF